MKIQIKDIILKYNVEYRKVKYTRFQLSYNYLNLILPETTTQKPEEIIQRKEDYIYNKIMEYKKVDEKTTNITLNNRDDKQLRQLVDKYVKIYEKNLNVKVKRLQLRKTKNKWGSCTAKQNITLSKDLKYLPEKYIKYIIYHELVHLIILKHDKAFYNYIKKEFPDYENLDNKLRLYEFKIFKNTRKKGDS